MNNVINIINNYKKKWLILILRTHVYGYASLAYTWKFARVWLCALAIKFSRGSGGEPRTAKKKLALSWPRKICFVCQFRKRSRARHVCWKFTALLCCLLVYRLRHGDGCAVMVVVEVMMIVLFDCANEFISFISILRSDISSYVEREISGFFSLLKKKHCATISECFFPLIMLLDLK